MIFTVLLYSLEARQKQGVELKILTSNTVVCQQDKGNYEAIPNAWSADCGIDSTCMKFFCLQVSQGGHIDELVDSVNIAMKAAMYFWELNNINMYADRGDSRCDIFSVSAKINYPSRRNSCLNNDGQTKSKSELNRLNVNGWENRELLTKKIFTCLKN